jgi:hypothetical protein
MPNTVETYTHHGKFILPLSSRGTVGILRNSEVI